MCIRERVQSIDERQKNRRRAWFWAVFRHWRRLRQRKGIFSIRLWTRISFITSVSEKCRSEYMRTRDPLRRRIYRLRSPFPWQRLHKKSRWSTGYFDSWRNWGPQQRKPWYWKRKSNPCFRQRRYDYHRSKRSAQHRLWQCLRNWNTAQDKAQRGAGENVAWEEFEGLSWGMKNGRKQVLQFYALVKQLIIIASRRNTACLLISALLMHINSICNITM